MYIKTLILENFQSHKHTTINLHPNFNCIVGSGNSGKTAIVRALNLLLYGQWESSWVRAGSDFCRITLITDSDTQVIREKGQTVNKYIIKIPSLKDQVYENFGTQVPTEISSVLGIFKVQLDSNEFLNLNIANQMDPLFLLSKSGSVKAKVIGKLTGAHFLDYALREINRDKKNITTEKNLKAIELLELQKQLIDYEYIDRQKLKLDEINEKVVSTTQKYTCIEELNQLFSRVQTWKTQYHAQCDEERKLSQFNTQILDNLSREADQINRLKDISRRLQQNYDSIQRLQQELTSIDQKLQQTKACYFQLLQDQKVCPTCFSEINDSSLELIKKSL
jgi:DNA repair protein SbcC/Rad50